MVSPPRFAAQVIEETATVDAGRTFTEARDHFEAQGARDSLVETSGVLHTIAVSMTRVSVDLRWMSSSTTTDLAEIPGLPDLRAEDEHHAPQGRPRCCPRPR